MSNQSPKPKFLQTRLGKIIAGGGGLALVALIGVNTYTPPQIDFNEAAKGFDKARENAIAVGIPIEKEDIWPAQKPSAENAEPLLKAMADIRQPLGSEAELQIQKAMAAQQFAEVEQGVKAYDSLVAMGNEAAQKKGFWTNKAWNGFARDFEFHRGVKAAAAALERKAFVALKAGKYADAEELLLNAHRLAVLVAEQPGINPALASVAIKTRSLQNVSLMASAFVDNQSAIETLSRVAEQLIQHPDLRKVVQGEALNHRFLLMTASTHGFAATARMYWLDSLDGNMEWAALETVPNNGDVEEKPETFTEKVIESKLKGLAQGEKNRNRVPLCLDQDPEADDVLGRALYARYYEIYGQILGFFKPDEKELTADRVREFTIWISEFQSKSQPGQISYMPATPSVSFADASAHILRSTSRAMATQEMLRRLRQRAISSLQVPSYPNDPITGKPFRMAVDGNSVLVYSPGFDGVDHRSKEGNHDDVIVRVTVRKDQINAVRRYFEQNTPSRAAPLN